MKKNMISFMGNLFRTSFTLPFSWNTEQSRAAAAALFFFLVILCLWSASQHQLIQASSGSPWTARVSDHADDARLAIDGQIETSWSTPMRPGASIRLDLGTPRSIEIIELRYQQLVDSFPDGYRIEISVDQMAWVPVVPVDVRVFSDAVEIWVPPMKTRYLKIIQTGAQHEMPWSINEIFLYHPAWLPRAYQYPAILICWCSLIGALAFIGLSTYPPLRNSGRLPVFGLSLAIAVGLFLRMFLVHAHDFNVDEVRYLTESFASMDNDFEWAARTFNKDHRMTAILYLIVTRGLFRLTQSSSLSIRLGSVIFGTLTIPLLSFVWLKLSSAKEACFEAVLSAGILAVFSYHITWSRDGHAQIQMTFFYVLSLLFIAQAITGLTRRISMFIWGGLFLFCGFLLNGSMLVAPGGFVLFIALDAVLTKTKLVRWQAGNVINYLLLLFIVSLFSLYLYYALIIQGGLVEATIYSHMEEHTAQTSLLSYLMRFFHTRWDIFTSNIPPPWWRLYGISDAVVCGIGGLSLAGLIDILLRRQKTEWFIILQPILFWFAISALWSTSLFERFCLPIVLPMLFLMARGITVLTRICKVPIMIRIVRIALSMVIIGYLSINTLFGIFGVNPSQRIPSTSYMAQVYSGRNGSFNELVRYIKHSERGSNSIAMLDPWWTFHYATTYNLNVRSLSPQQLAVMVNQRSDLPVFIIMTPTWRINPVVEKLLVDRYDRVGTSLTGKTLYELRKNS